MNTFDAGTQAQTVPTPSSGQDESGVIVGLGRSAAELAAIVDPDRALTGEQAAIVGAGAGPALVVAGAGSGKTETLSLRILFLLDNAKHLVGRHISPDELLCLTFTRKAAAEIAERASKRIAAVYGADVARPDVSVSTYNGFAARLVAEHGLRVAVDPSSTILSDAALWQLADAVVSSWQGEVDTESAVSVVTSALPRLAAQARDHRVSPEQLRDWALGALATMDALPKKAGDASPGTFTADLDRQVGKLRTLAAMAELVAEFDKRKREGSLLDFSDQVEIAVRLAAIPAVQQAERAAFAAVLLDEFQDTSPPQLDLFERLFGSTHPVTAVGDPNQAIYGFRGASAAALGDFVSRFGSDSVALHSLSVSWRNEASVLKAANAIVAPLAQGARPATVLRSRGEHLGVPEPTRRAPGVVASRHVTDADEAAAVVGFIQSRRAELAVTAGRQVTAAILCRRRSQYGPIVEALASAGVDFEVVGLGGLLELPEVADLVSLLRVAHDPSRGDSLMRLLAGERLAIGPRDLAALFDWAGELAGPRRSREADPSIVDAIATLPGAGWQSQEGRSLTQAAIERLGKLARVIDSIRTHAYLPLTELVLFAERAWNLDIESAVARHGSRQRRSVDALVDSVRGFAAGTQRATLGALLSWLDAAVTQEDGLDAPVREPDPAAVQVLTVHASKGLEWDVVAVPGMNDGQFPKVSPPSNATPFYSDSAWLDGVGRLPHELRLDRDSLAHWSFAAARDHKDLSASIRDFKASAGLFKLDEERRLFYVALTRARSHVLLSGSWFTSGVTMRQPSPFVTALIEADAVAVGSWAEPPADGVAPTAEPQPVLWPVEPGAERLRIMDLASKVAGAAAEPGAADHIDKGLPLAREVSAMMAERESRLALAGQVRLPSHLSTSALVALRRDEAGFALQLRRPIPVEPTEAAAQGSALHAWIEAQFGSVPLWQDEDGDQDQGALEQLKKTFLASEWAGRSPSHIEADVDLALGGITIRSRIDAVFPATHGLEKVTVVDWKSGMPPSDPQERAAREVQLAMYRLAWAERSGLALDEVDAAFYYVAADLTVRPSSLLTRQELEELVNVE